MNGTDRAVIAFLKKAELEAFETESPDVRRVVNAISDAIQDIIEHASRDQHKDARAEAAARSTNVDRIHAAWVALEYADEVDLMPAPFQKFGSPGMPS